jgi:hypothetical protein
MATEDLWEDYDDTLFFVVGNYPEDEMMQRIVPHLIEMVCPGERYADHIDDVKIITGGVYRIGVRLDLWRGLTPLRQAECVAYVRGWADALY